MRKRKVSYGRMCEELLESIRSGELAPGVGLPSENQLAQQYSICRSSVRTGLISLEEENLIGRQAGKGWFVRIANTPHIASNDSVSSKLYTIAEDLNLLSVPWYHQLIFSGIRTACNALGVRQVFYDTENLCSMREGFCDGLICAMPGTAGGMKENPLLTRLPDLGISPVVINRLYENPKIGYVACDYFAEAQKSAEFLKKLGINKLCYIKAVDNSASLKIREQGVLCHYTKAQLTDCTLPAYLSSKEYISVLLNRFKESGIPQAIYLENGSFAVPLFRAFQKMGIQPESAPLVFCFDNISYLQDFFDYPVYYLRMPLEIMMEDAVRYLVNKSEDPSVPVLKKIYRAEIKYCNFLTI